MPNISEINQELVKAFNTNLCCHNIAFTNLTVQNLDGKDHIVISFDKNMKHGQRMKYLSALKDKIIKRSYKDEKAAGVSYNLQSFPFNFNKGRLEKDNKGKRFSVEIDEGVVFNLKCYLAQALAGDVQEDMGKKFGVKYVREHIYDISFDRSSYLLCMRFDDWKLKVYFINSFSSKIARYEENAPRDYLEIIGNCVYIKKSIFDNVEFIKDIEAHNASLICRDFEISIKEDRRLESLKFPKIDFIHRIGIPVYHLFHTSYKGSDENSVLIPIVAKSGKGNRLLDDNDAYKINSTFNMEILSDVSESISVRLPKSDSSDGIIYGIDFSDLDIACCVLNKIMESSVINKDHELSIDPELHFRELSPAQSPFNSPTHAEPPRTPPEQTGDRFFESEGDRDSGIGESPPKHKDSVAHSPSGGPRSLFEQPQAQEFPTRSQGEELGGSPRRGSEKFSVVLPKNPLDVPEMSEEFPPQTYVSCATINFSVPGSSSPSQSVGAAKNVQASTSAWSQPMGAWSFQVSSAGFSSWSQSGPSSWKGANPVGANPRAQPMSPWLSQGTSGNKWQLPLQLPGSGLSGLSWKGAAQNVQVGTSASNCESLHKRPASVYSADSGYSGSLERPQPNSSITTSAVPGISESGKGSNVAAVPVDNKRPQSLPLTENTPKPSSESPKKIIQQFFRNLSIRRSKSNGKATKDILQFDKETFSSFSSGMQKVLSLPLSLDMIRNLFPHFPMGKREKLILLARSEKVKKSHSSPEEIEQLLSSLLSEEQEICSLLFFPDRKNETYVDLSPGAKEQVVLFWEVLRGRGFNSTSSEESGIFSGSSLQGSTSDDKDELEASGRSSVSSNSSISTESPPSPASPAMPHKGSVSSELKHPQQVKHMSKALGK